LKCESDVACLVSCLCRQFFTDIFCYGFGIIILKTLVFTALVFAWVLVDGPALFKSEVDWRTGGPEGLWLLDGILSVPADRESAKSCRKYAESRNLFFGDDL
jgi:hypothetical protein